MGNMDNLNFAHGGNIYEVKREYKKDVIDFSANINPLGLPAGIKKALCKNFNKILHYPESQPKKLQRKIAQYWGISEENILLGNGSVELIYLIAHTFKPKIAAIPAPSFCEYQRAAKSVGSRIRFLKLKEREGFKFNLSHLPYADMLFFCNPNNPTGNLIAENSDFIEKLSYKLNVVDEAFMDFLPDEKKHTLIRLAQKNKRFIVLRTLTKFFALPGLRIGYLAAHRDIIDKLKCHLPPWNTNCLAQIAAELILSEKEYIKKTRKFMAEEREFFFEQLSQINGLKFYPTAVNFVLIKIKDKDITSSILVKKLIEKGILVRDCSNFRGLSNEFIRIAIRSHNENLKLLAELRELVR